MESKKIIDIIQKRNKDIRHNTTIDQYIPSSLQALQPLCVRISVKQEKCISMNEFQRTQSMQSIQMIRKKFRRSYIIDLWSVDLTEVETTVPNSTKIEKTYEVEIEIQQVYSRYFLNIVRANLMRQQTELFVNIITSLIDTVRHIEELGR